MSDDPETLRQIEELALDARPLLVVDVDEVVLEFVTPFSSFLASRDLDLGMGVFKLHGNIFSKGTKDAIGDDQVTVLIDEFWGVQADWQQIASGADAALASLASSAQIVLLTAMPHRFREHRQRHLEALGLPYPLLTTEAPKGPAVARIRGEGGRRAAFVDDILHNHLSVQKAAPDIALFHLMAHDELRALQRPMPEGVTAVEGWVEAEPLIAQALGLSRD